MKLAKLVEKLDVRLLQGSLDCEIGSLTADSRKAGAQSVFVCIVGAVSDGHKFICEVAGKHAAAVLVQRGAEYEGISKYQNLTVIEAEDTRYAYALMSAAYFDYPAQKLKTIGITGTKGKTTTTYMVRDILERCGHKTGLIGTIETIIGEEHIHAGNTTPESYVIQETFYKMVQAGMEAVVMEVSSQGLMLHRTAGIQFDIGVFTNIEPDHIGPNEHSSFEEYLACKARLFSQCKVGIVNGDDAHVQSILVNASCEVETYGMAEGNALCAVDIRLTSQPGRIGTQFLTQGLVNTEIQLCMPGKFSVYNALCAIAVTEHFGVDTEVLKKALYEVKVRGRIELVKVSDDFTVIVDYAHNAMALESLLKTLQEYHPQRIVTVFGCGGNRSKARRFEMGEVSGRLSDMTVITSDNPRFEEPQAIIDDIITGIKRTSGSYIAIVDRQEAIDYAVSHAQKGDIIVIAGKGHEDYQEIKGVKHHMDDVEMVKRNFACTRI